jgi:hypothetical protein
MIGICDGATSGRPCRGDPSLDLTIVGGAELGQITLMAVEPPGAGQNPDGKSSTEGIGHEIGGHGLPQRPPGVFASWVPQVS